MTCHDTREWLSAWRDGALTVEERADVDAHLAVCADCRQELERLRETVELLHAIAPVRAPSGFVDRVLAASRPEPWPRRLVRRLFWPLPVKLPLEGAAVALVAVVAVYLYQQSPDLQQAARPDVSLSTPAPPASPTPGAAISDKREPQPGPVARPEPPTATAPLQKRVPGTPVPTERSYAKPSAPEPSAERDAADRIERADSPPKDVAGAPLAAGPAPRREAEAPSVARPSAEEPSAQRDSAERAQRADSPSKDVAGPPPAASPAPRQKAEAPSVARPSAEAYRSEGKAAEANKESREKQAAAAPTPPAGAGGRVGSVGQERSARTLAAPGPTSAAQQSEGASVILPADVVGRLTVPDREVAERGLADLVKRVGGTLVTRRRESARVEVVEISVPRAAYADLSEGLARLGRWVPEREAANLPPEVRVSLRITD